MSDASLKMIIDLLMRRRNAGYVAGRDQDGEHIALVVEGGGMRGVAAGGMVSALEDLAMTDCFDSIHGSSAGAAAAAYFCCGQANAGTRIYYEDLIDERFISRKRLMKLKDIMDISYLVDYVMQFVKPIDFSRIQSKSSRLHIVTTDIDRAEAYTFNQFKDYAHYRECLKASLTLPFIAGGPRTIDSRRLMDGGLAQQIPINSAVAAGATKILVLMTRRHDEQYRPEFSWAAAGQSYVLQAFYGGMVGAICRKRNSVINESVRLIDAGRDKAGALVAGIRLHSAIDYVHRLTQNPALLKLAAETSRVHVLDVFAQR